MKLIMASVDISSAFSLGRRFRVKVEKADRYLTLNISPLKKRIRSF